MTSKTVKTETINLHYFKCPICQTRGEYITEEQETYCKHCGCIIITPYPYTAGIKHKTLSDFQIENYNKKTDKRRKRQWKKIISVHMQHG